jgi:hypothetical protein
MDLVKWFFPDQIPEQMLYLGEEGSLLLSKSRDGRWREINRLPHGLIDLSAMTSLPGFKKGPLGLSINPNPFVFNLFNFDAPLPIHPRKRNELIEWRLQRVFPDAPADMMKPFLIFRRRTVLSTLISRETVRACEGHFASLGYRVTYVGCSSVAAIRKTAALSKAPLMILEQEGQLLMVTVVQGGVPLFVRKIRFTQAQELLTTFRKTLAFVNEQQGIAVRVYLMSPLGGAAMAWLEEIEEIGPVSLPSPLDPHALFLP